MDTREFICLAEDGDRTIIVGEAEGDQRLYKVDSRSMAMASPIWKAMFSITNGFRESSPNEPVEFPEDDADALLILLRIIHYRFDEVPKELPSFDWLLEIAVLCDKYDTTRLVRPFIGSWMRPWLDFYLEPGYEHWLFIAWTFGCQEIFDNLAAALVLRVEVHKDGKIKTWLRPRSRETSQDRSTNCEDAWISDENMPPEIIGYVQPCDLGAMMLPDLDSILRDLPSAVMDHHIRHIEEQAKKSGLANLPLPSPTRGRASAQRVNSAGRLVVPS